jgi:branched-chain amino acid transport system ATP-binding protein
MFELVELSAYYEGVRALDGVSLEVHKGEIVAIIGSNGVGKTTLLMCAAGLHLQLRGRILFEGKDVTRLSASEIVRLGVSLVPEGRQLFPSISVEDNLALGAFARKIDKKGLLLELEKVYRLYPVLKERRKQLAGTLSGGEQQMLAIGRGLVSGPKLLLLDEPAIGLAPQMVSLIFNVILRLREEDVTILLVEQNAKAALRLADRGYVMVTGRIEMTDSANKLLNNDFVKRCYLGA